MKSINLSSRSLYIASRCAAIIPGISRMILFYYDNDKAKYTALLYTGENDDYEEINEVNGIVYDRMKSFTKGSDTSKWISSKNLEFEISENSQFQSSVFDEEENTVLVQKIKSENKNSFDIILLYFNRDATNFGLQKDVNMLSTDSKAILSTIIKNNTNVFFNDFQSLKKREFDYKAYLNKLASKYNDSKEELNLLKLKNKESIIDFCEEKLRELAIKFSYEFVLTDSAKELLEKLENIDYKVLYKQIEYAAKFAIYSSSSGENSIVSIYDWHFDDKKLNSQQSGNLNNDFYDSEKIPEAKYRSTYLLLNRLESAARKLKAEGEKLTSSKVGKAMDSPISAPAISDALRKHRGKINTLLKQYPDNWKIIRFSFKPMINIIDKSSMQAQKSA